MVYQETFAQRNQHRIYVREYPGVEPTIMLMHGFPDNLHLYDRLIPYLSPRRRVIAFDFLGWGASDKPPGYPYTAANQVGDYEYRLVICPIVPGGGRPLFSDKGTSMNMKLLNATIFDLGAVSLDYAHEQ